MEINYYMSPYYRIFFGQKYAAGFFIEGFGLGGKWMTKRGFVFELSGGGRNLFDTSGSEYYDYSPIVGKFGFNLGYKL